jgi:hypothetical protein
LVLTVDNELAEDDLVVEWKLDNNKLLAVEVVVDRVWDFLAETKLI